MMKDGVIISAFIAMESALDVKVNIVVGYAQKDEFTAGLLIAGYNMFKNPELGVVSINACLHGASNQEFPGDLGVDRHGYLYVASQVHKVPGGTKTQWVRSSKPFLAKKISKIINVMSIHAQIKGSPRPGI